MIIRLTAILMTGLLVAASGLMLTTAHTNQVIAYTSAVTKDHDPVTKGAVHRVAGYRLKPPEDTTHREVDCHEFDHEAGGVMTLSNKTNYRESAIHGEIWIVGPQVK